jgi:hypothetical protein
MYTIPSYHADKWVIAVRQGVNARSACAEDTIDGWQRAPKLQMALFCPLILMRRLDHSMYILLAKGKV